MSWILGFWEQEHEVLEGQEFVFSLPDIVLADGGAAQSVENAPGGAASGTAWDITIAGAPTGMGFNRRTRTKILTKTSGRLSTEALYWTPAPADCFLLQDGRQKRPRFWIVTVQVTGRGNWSGRQWDFALTLIANDRRLHVAQQRDAESIAAHGVAREAPLAWYKHDNLAAALLRRYTTPPLISEWTFPLVQPNDDELRKVLLLQPGDLVHLDPNGLSGLRPHTAMVLEVKYTLPPGGRGLGYKQIVTVERLHGETVTLAVNGVVLSVGGVELAVGG